MKSDRPLAHPNILHTFPLSAAGKPGRVYLGLCRKTRFAEISLTRSAGDGREDRLSSLAIRVGFDFPTKPSSVAYLKTGPKIGKE